MPTKHGGRVPVRSRHHNSPRSPRSVPSGARQRIELVTDDLFYRYGIRSVGIDRIIAESDVAKMTFYKHFPSKANLIATYLVRQKERWSRVLETALTLEGSALDRILAIFDAVNLLCRTPSYQGCPFIKAMAEFGRDHDEVQIQAHISSYFRETESKISGLIAQMDVPKELAQVIVSLIFGAIVVTHSGGPTDTVQINRAAARLLLSTHLKRGDPALQ